jgi:hypothetical protein
LRPHGLLPFRFTHAVEDIFLRDEKSLSSTQLFDHQLENMRTLKHIGVGAGIDSTHADYQKKNDEGFFNHFFPSAVF